jgi:hypothetical protein
MPPAGKYRHPIFKMLTRQLERVHDHNLIESEEEKKLIKSVIDVLKGNSTTPSVSNEETTEAGILAIHNASSNRCPTCGAVLKVIK